MKILVTGGSGLLGAHLVSLAQKEGHMVLSSYKSRPPTGGEPIQLDLAELPAIVLTIRKVAPDIIIHTASLADVDLCEQEPELARLVNGEATGKVAEAAAALQAYLIYVSTDYVFDGNDGMYEEDDVPNPVNSYGESKLLGEQFVRESGARYCVARTSVLYGWGREHRPNFATWVLNKLRSRQVARVVNDQHVSPTLNLNLAEMILDVSKKRLEGTLHLAGATRIDRYNFALRIADVFQLDPGSIEQVSSKDIGWIAKRPTDSSLDVSTATRLLDRKPLKLDTALERFRGEQTR
jgi:dTDP-4-dehydrorhamnose reductase